jgi:hypothetical protein
MSIERLSEDAIQRVSGPAWRQLKPAYMQMSEILLAAAPDGVGVLTTIYVKYQVDRKPNSGVFAVAWLKNSKQIVLGLALPDDIESPLLGTAPAGMKYKGITKYLTIQPGDQLPAELAAWAKTAFENVVTDASS